MFHSRIFLAILCLIVFSANSFAYIDPGTGGMIAGSMIPVIGGILAMAAGFIALKIIGPAKGKAKEIWEKLKGIGRKKVIIAAILVAFVFVLAWFFFMAGKSVDANSGKAEKVLLIGIDAFDPKIVGRLMDEGKMPNFKRLSLEGSFSDLETTIPPETPVAWSSAATGMNPGGHGIFDFISRDSKTYLPRLNLAREKQGVFGTEYESSLEGKPFWEIASEKGIPATVIRWPVTFPASEVNGKMLSGLGVVDIKGMLSGYRFYTSVPSDAAGDGAEKVVVIDVNGGTMHTFVGGPYKMGAGGREEVTTPMEIILSSDGGAKIRVSEKEHAIRAGEWSEWIESSFKIDFLTEVQGIFKVYLVSSSPFRMYAASVQFNPKKPYKDISYPKNFSRELAGEIGIYYTLGMPEETKGVTEKRLPREALALQVNEIESEREKMFWSAFKDFNSGVLAFAFDAGDRLEHIFWEKDWRTKEIPKEIEAYYVGKDEFLGKVLGAIDSKTALIVFSDHGFNSFEREVSVNTWLIENGCMVVSKTPSESDAGELFKYVDWSKTKAYSLGFNSIYLNLAGREGKGIVKESEKEKIASEIISKLKAWVDPKTGKKVMLNVYSSSEIYSGEFLKDAPDIVTGTSDGYRLSWQNAVGGATKEALFDNKGEWKGEHLMDHSFVPGVVFSNKKIVKQKPAVWDIAPTVLGILGIPEKGMGGKSIFS